MPATDGSLDVAYLATQGNGSLDERRIASLLEPLGARALPFDRKDKRRSAVKLLRELKRRRPDVVVLEGTGLAGGLACMASRVPFVLSSGDAVGPYLAMLNGALRFAGPLYERALYRSCAGFIGWSPYLVGRALSLGAPRGMTAANWSHVEATVEDRRRTRARLGIPDDAIVLGIVGSLNWSDRRQYCYGLELVRAVKGTTRTDVVVLIVGDGSGLTRLESLAGDLLGTRILLPGRVPPEEVGAYLAALDVASLPQSLDLVGSLRYTTKISEYLTAGLPVITGRLPLAYDLDDGWIWRLPGHAPWSEQYVSALTGWMNELTPDEVESRRSQVPRGLPLFSLERQQRQVCSFVQEVAQDSRKRPD